MHLHGVSILILLLPNLWLFEVFVLIKAFVVVLVKPVRGAMGVVPYALTRAVEIFSLFELLFRTK